MSTERAIQTVTTALKNRLGPAAGGRVNSETPDVASAQEGPSFLNLFLYEVLPNGAWRNQEYPSRGGSATLRPPLAVDLRYLVTAHPQDRNEAEAHGILGYAMRLLHDAPLLTGQELRDADVNGTGVDVQMERVKVTQLHLPLEELSKLWTALGTSYRLSVAYQATVVLIDTTAPAPAPLPVLQRGSRDPAEDEPPYVGPAAGPSIERLFVLEWENPSLPAREGDHVVIEGRGLASDDTRIRLMHPALAATALEVIPDEISGDRLVARVPDELPLGFSTLAVALVQAGGGAITSNLLPLAKAARLVLATMPGAGRTVQLEATLTPAPREGAQVVFLFGDQQRPATRQGASARFAATADLPAGLPAGTAIPVRVRVDGVDSIPLPDPVAGQPLPRDWDPAQSVVVP